MAKKEETADLLENSEVIKEKLEGAEHWIESNPKLVFGVLGAIVLLVGGFFGYRHYMGSQDDLAQKEMFQAIRYFESDSLTLALKGDGNNLGFTQIAEDYSKTKAGRLANFYIGYINLKQGNFKGAILYLEDFTADDLLVQARAYSLTGDAYMELNDYENAVKFYNKAANHHSNKFFSPSYIMKAAVAYEKLNQNDKAKELYQTIIDKYWDSNEFQDAKKFKARLDANS